MVGAAPMRLVPDVCCHQRNEQEFFKTGVANIAISSLLLTLCFVVQYQYTILRLQLWRRSSMLW